MWKSIGTSCSHLVAEAATDMGDSLSVILLEKQEQSYLLDKGLEFYEILSFSHADWIHTVWASSDGYSEDIYIPFSTETQELVERRCC